MVRDTSNLTYDALAENVPTTVPRPSPLVSPAAAAAATPPPSPPPLHLPASSPTTVPDPSAAPFGPHRWGDGEGAPLVVDLAAAGEPIDLAALTGHPGPFAIEIGPGRGYFLMAMARADPKTMFLGLEYKNKRVWKLARRLLRANLGNARIAWVDANSAVPRLAPDSVSAIYVNFPDPWPKRRHHKKRLLQAPLAQALARALAPGACLTVATDHAEYSAQILDCLESTAGLASAFGPRVVRDQIQGYPVDAFEEQFRKEGRSLFFMRYVKVSSVAPAPPMP